MLLYMVLNRSKNNQLTRAADELFGLQDTSSLTESQYQLLPGSNALSKFKYISWKKIVGAKSIGPNDFIQIVIIAANFKSREVFHLVDDHNDSPS